MKQENALNRFSALASAYEIEFFETYPELGMVWGRADVPQDRFMDHSLAAIMAWQERENYYLSALNQFDESVFKGSPLSTTFQLLKETLENNKAARVCHELLWNVNPTLGGWVSTTTRVAEMQPVGTPDNRALALKRWNTFGTIADDEINNLKEGIRQGYTAPKAAVRAVIEQLNIVINTAPELSPYFDFARRDGDAAFKAEVTTLIRTLINPSLKRYADYLELEYWLVARDSIGVSSLPNGAACYKAKVKQETTLDISPQEIYDFGIQHMEVLNQEVASIGQKLWGVRDMAHLFQLAKTMPEYLFESEQAILDYNFAALKKAQLKLGTQFLTIPKLGCTIKPYPLYRAKTGAAGEYNPPSEDGSQLGIYYINTYEPTQRSRVDQEATLFHELLPGHHLQVAVSYENALHHTLDKYLWKAGYGEGWALYAERLADEMGLYSDDISRLGMLSNEALRTARLVVDPGMHVMNWTRDQAIEYLSQHTALSDNIIQAEVDRYIMLPGQATAYMLGKRQIEDLRELSRTTLKDSFDVREFHDQVLKNGAVSLRMLQAQILEWLNAHSNT